MLSVGLESKEKIPDELDAGDSFKFTGILKPDRLRIYIPPEFGGGKKSADLSFQGPASFKTFIQYAGSSYIGKSWDKESLKEHDKLMLETKKYLGIQQKMWNLNKIDAEFEVDFGKLPEKYTEEEDAGKLFIQGQAVMKFTKGTTIEKVEEFALKNKLHIQKVTMGMVLMGMPFDMTTKQAMEKFEPKKEKIIEYIERNAIIAIHREE